MEDNQITVTATAVVLVLGVIASMLVLASIGSHLTASLTGHGFFPPDDASSKIDELVLLLSVDKERNLPTYFSTFLLIFAALLLGVITVLDRRRSKSRTIYWATLSSGFVFMACDELLRIHERLIRPMRKVLSDDYFGIFHFGWVIPYAVLVFIFGLFFLRFLFGLARSTRLAFLAAGQIYIAGAIGCELIGGYVEKSLMARETMTYVMITTLEESLEMAGVIVFIWALLVYLSQLQRNLYPLR